MMKIPILILLICTTRQLMAQENAMIREGNDYYRRQQFDKAAEEYQKALSSFPGSKVAKFNLANAMIRQNKMEEADKLLTDLNTSGTDADLRSKAAYNTGVMFSHQKKLEESIEAYEESLRLNPNDQEARENLQKALLELKKNNPPKKQEDKKKKDQQQQKQPPKPKISPREAQQQLKLLEQKEKEVQERLKKNSKTGSSQPKDW